MNEPDPHPHSRRRSVTPARPTHGDQQSLAAPAAAGRAASGAGTGAADLSQRRDSGADGRLSEEELAILRLAADGLPLYSVARHVGMSPRTVRRRLRNLCDRLGVTHPVQAIVWAARRDLI